MSIWRCSIPDADPHLYIVLSVLDWLWPALCDAFAPWLVPYYPHAMQQQHQQPSSASVPSQAQLSPAAVQPANWIRQVLANADVLLPWSELYGREAQHMAHAYVDCTLYLLDTLPGSDQLLGHIFHWYEAHYANVFVPRHVRQTLHAALRRLPWERFRPLPVHIECIHRALQQFLPESHAFMGHVFVRVQWAEWLRQQLPLWDRGQRSRMLSALLHVYTKLSFEPNVRESHGRQLLAMLQEAAAFPWTALPCDGLLQVMDSLVLLAEPAILLTTLNAERHHEAVDAAVLKYDCLAFSSIYLVSETVLTVSKCVQHFTIGQLHADEQQRRPAGAGQADHVREDCCAPVAPMRRQEPAAADDRRWCWRVSGGCPAAAQRH